MSYILREIANLSRSALYQLPTLIWVNEWMKVFSQNEYGFIISISEQLIYAGELAKVVIG